MAVVIVLVLILLLMLTAADVAVVSYSIYFVSQTFNNINCHFSCRCCQDSQLLPLLLLRNQHLNDAVVS